MSNLEEMTEAYVGAELAKDMPLSRKLYSKYRSKHPMNQNKFEVRSIYYFGRYIWIPLLILYMIAVAICSACVILQNWKSFITDSSYRVFVIGVCGPLFLLGFCLFIHIMKDCHRMLMVDGEQLNYKRFSKTSVYTYDDISNVMIKKAKIDKRDTSLIIEFNNKERIAFSKDFNTQYLVINLIKRKERFGFKLPEDLISEFWSSQDEFFGEVTRMHK